MFKTVIAIRRVLVLTSLSIALIATVVLFSLGSKAQASVYANVDGPVVNEAWYPANFSTVYITGTSKLSVAMFPPTTVPFTITSLMFRVIMPVLPPDITTITDTVTATIASDYSYALLTATNFEFTTHGEQVQFVVTYVTESNPIPTTTSATYIVDGVKQTYIPLIVSKFGIGGNAGNDPCLAGNAEALIANPTVQDSPYKFYGLYVPTTATLLMTVTNYPLSGQMQLRTMPVTGCSPTGTQYTRSYSVIPATPVIAAYNITAGLYLARFSSDNGVTSTTPFTFTWQYIPATGLNEPNNSACYAVAVSLNTNYQDYPEDNEDWFSFDLTATQSISIGVNNYTGSSGQIQLVKQTTTCGDIGGMQVVKLAGFVSGSSTIPLTSVGSGRYYLRVYTGSNQNQSTLYNFTVYSDLGLWNPAADRCTAYSNCWDHANPDASQTIYWKGAPGAESIRVEWVATGHTSTNGTCPAGSGFAAEYNAGSNPNIAAITPSGSVTYNSLTTGYYIINVTFRKSGVSNVTKSMGLKVNCDFLANVLSPWSQSSVNPPIGPTQPWHTVEVAVPIDTDGINPKVTPAP